jgi:leader peptidase (prepilin peptidase) / N-methyltransferase
MSPLGAALLAAVLGLAAGSFANVVIHRVPRKESVVRPGSRCPACGGPIAPRDNLPVLGWLLLRGRCRRCQAPISVRYPVVELAMALLWALVAYRLWSDGLAWAVPAYLAVAFVCVVLTVIDASSKLLPNRITYPAFPAVALLLLGASLALHDLGRMQRGLLAALVTTALFFLLFLVYPGGMGFGDVKFVPTLGLALGWLSWPVLAVGIFAAFLLGGVIGVAAIVVLRLGRKSLLPFGPWLATGALLAVLAGSQIAGWYGDALLRA